MTRSCKYLSDENGNQLIEFLGLLPLILMVGLIVFQLILAGQTVSVAASAAREAARAKAVCGDVYGAFERASLGYVGNRELTSLSQNETYTVATVQLNIPLLNIAFVNNILPPVISKASVRTEVLCP